MYIIIIITTAIAITIATVITITIKNAYQQEPLRIGASMGYRSKIEQPQTVCAFQQATHDSHIKSSTIRTPYYTYTILTYDDYGIRQRFALRICPGTIQVSRSR